MQDADHKTTTLPTALMIPEPRGDCVFISRLPSYAYERLVHFEEKAVPCISRTDFIELYIPEQGVHIRMESQTGSKPPCTEGRHAVHEARGDVVSTDNQKSPWAVEYLLYKRKIARRNAYVAGGEIFIRKASDGGTDYSACRCVQSAWDSKCWELRLSYVLPAKTQLRSSVRPTEKKGKGQQTDVCNCW